MMHAAGEVSGITDTRLRLRPALSSLPVGRGEVDFTGDRLPGR